MKELFVFQDCPCSGKKLSRLVQPAVMALLLQEPLHGYRILELLREETMFRDQPPDQAGVYKILKNMEQDGHVSCNWETQDSGPARKLYTLTEKGLHCLEQWKKTLVEYQASVASVILLLDRQLGAASK